MRVTQRALILAFQQFIKMIGGKIASAKHEVGRYTLERDTVYGWTILKYVNEGGGVDHPFGMEPMTVGELYQALRFARHTLQEAERNRLAFEAEIKKLHNEDVKRRGHGIRI